MNNDKKISKRARIAAIIIADDEASYEIKRKARVGLSLLSISDLGEQPTWATRLIKMFDDLFES